MSIPEVLEACADKWESGQWTLDKGRYISSDERASEKVAACSLGGIRLILANRAGSPTLFYVSAAVAMPVIKYLASKLPEVSENGVALHSADRVVNWNDNPSRTKEEVIEFFKQAAKDFRNEQGEGNGSQGH